MNLQEGRLGLGLSLEQVSRRLRIPVEHLRALEEGRLDKLPRGPYAAAHLRAYRDFLGLDDPSAPEGEKALLPSMTMRERILVRVGAVLVLFLVIAAGAWGLLPSGDQPVEAGLDQVVEIEAKRTTQVRVEADGAPVFDRELPGGERVRVEAADRIVVELQSTGHAKVLYNGSRVVPLGMQDASRRLVFIDDEGM